MFDRVASQNLISCWISVVVLLVLPAFLAACAGGGVTPEDTSTGSEETEEEETEEEETVRDIGVTEVSRGDLGQGRKSPYVVVSDEAEIPGQESQEGREASNPEPPEGATYLTVYRGEERTSGYSVKVESVRREGGEVVVTLELRDPPEGAILAQVITYPYASVALSGVDVEDDFVFEDTRDNRLDWPVES